MKKFWSNKTDVASLAGILFWFAAVSLLQLSPVITKFFFAGILEPNVEYLRGFAACAHNGFLPYRDFPIEYPPLGALWFMLLAHFGPRDSGFYEAFTFGMFLWSLFGLLGVIRLSDLVSKDGPTPARRLAASVFYTVAIIAVGPTGLASLDYIPMALTAWALVALARRRQALALAILAAAFAVKVYPAVLVPLFLYESYRQSGWRGLLRGIAGFASAAAAIFALPLIYAPKDLLESYTYHSQRGIEVGSSYAAAMLFLKHFGLKTAILPAYGAWNVVAGGTSHLFKTLSSFILLLLILRAYARLIRIVQRKPPAPDEPARDSLIRVISVSGMALSAFIIGFKVGSPQFLCWLVPVLVPLALDWRGLPRLVLFAAAGVASTWIYPWHMQSLVVGQNPTLIAALCLKWLLMIGVFIDLIFSVKLPEREHMKR